MTATRMSVETFHSRLPPEWPEPLLPRIRERLTRSGERLVVLDDDATGTQTVHGVPVLTTWDAPLIADTLRRDPVVYLLTNSRSLPEAGAVQLAMAIGEQLRTAAERLGTELRVASRSDSTLRGHFPAEVDALTKALGVPYDGYLLVPALPEAGRFTWDDVHWIERDQELIPVGETEYAGDATFGFRSSRLPDWVEEKSRGRIRSSEVLRLTLEDIRRGGPSMVAKLVSVARGGQVIVVNAISYSDLEVVAAGVQLAESDGKRLIYRCAAAFVRARGGIAERPLLTRTELPTDQARGGLVVCGSHVLLSTMQLDAALAIPGVDGVELAVESIMGSPRERAAFIARTAERASAAIRAGRHAIIYTSRSFVRSEGMPPLVAGQLISDALVSVTRALDTRPAFIIGKGGITSSDIATKALEIRRADVLGQIQPGVSVWRTTEGRFAGTPFVVFPGNVGHLSTLADVILMLSA